MERLRRHRNVIGAIVSFVLLLDLFGAVLLGQQDAGAGDDPASIEALLADSLCTVDGGPGTPSDPGRHDDSCPLCAMPCPMGGCAPVGPLAARAAVVLPERLVVGRVVFHPVAAHVAAVAPYPSDVVSQAPPAAA